MPSPKTCCAEAVKNAAHPKCPQCPKPGKECNETANCSLNCPMCYMTILSGTHEVSGLVVMVKKLYPAFQSDYVYAYHADAWKPPNRA